MRSALVLLVLISIVGCAGTRSDPVTTIDIQDANSTIQSMGSQYAVWADGRLSWNFDSEALDFLPSRTSDYFINVWYLLQPPHCMDCVKLHIDFHDPVNKIMAVLVTLKNPTGLTGSFVRGTVHIPDGNSVEFVDPDAWWHSNLQPDTEMPDPFLGFATTNIDYEFPPYSEQSQLYVFAYENLADFSDLSYRVITRYPLNPSEVLRLENPSWIGQLTKQGGFLTLRIEMEEAPLAPDVTMQSRIAFGDDEFFDWHDMRNEEQFTYIDWFPGEATSADSATIWVRALMEGIEQDYMAYRLEFSLDDVTPQETRHFPTVGNAPSVFVDQLTTQMTPQQMDFMATNCVGSQKLVKSLADSMREYNQQFIILQYHLAFGAGDISNIHGNDWINNWYFETAQEDFFEHRSWSTQPQERVLQQDWNWYLCDPTGDWTNYFIGNCLDRMAPLGDQFDGVFADSASQPWNTDPAKWWEGSDDPHDMFTYWTPRTQEFFDRVTDAFHTLPTSCYLIPNAGSYVTTISDITYYQCDGVMIEGFAHWGPDNYFTEADWRLQMNRVRDLAVMDKIILCQTDVAVDNTLDRSFVLGSYMLLKDNFTYLNMLGPWSLQPQWWPEYHWNPGASVEDWNEIDEIQDAGGCYVRHFDNGIIIVNPSDEPRYYTTDKMYSHTMYGEGGILPEDGVPTGIATGPIVEAGEQEIVPHSAWMGVG